MIGQVDEAALDRVVVDLEQSQQIQHKERPELGHLASGQASHAPVPPEPAANCPVTTQTCRSAHGRERQLKGR